MPSLTGCMRYRPTAADNRSISAPNAENTGAWGYNNLQWYGGTYYHKFNDQWHISVESYTLGQNNVLNRSRPGRHHRQWRLPILDAEWVHVQRAGHRDLRKPATSSPARHASFTVLEYLNYRMTTWTTSRSVPSSINDENGQRTGVKTRYVDVGLGWQHWFSPQVYIRPEVSVYQALDAPAFNANTNCRRGRRAACRTRESPPSPRWT